MLDSDEGNQLICSKEHDKWHQSQLEPREWLQDVAISIYSEFERTISVKVTEVRFPITKDVVHQVFGKFGIEDMVILPKGGDFEALIRFKLPSNAKLAKCYDGRYVYDGGELLTIEYSSQYVLNKILVSKNMPEMMSLVGKMVNGMIIDAMLGLNPIVELSKEKIENVVVAQTGVPQVFDESPEKNENNEKGDLGVKGLVGDVLEVLSIAPGDEDAVRCKIVAFIENKSIDEALTVIELFSKKSSIDFIFLKAYCLYRQNKLNEALESLKGKEESSANMLLESQILFRLGKMDACVDIYQKLQKSKIDSLEINFVAGLVSAGKASEVEGTLNALRVKPTSSFKLAYTVACSLIEKNKYRDAEQLLLSARRIGQETLVEDNLADDDIEKELAPMTVQLAYVQQVLGNTQEVFETCTNVIKKNLADESSLAVAISNLISLKGPKDVSDGLRKLDKLIEKSGEAPVTFQLARGLDLKLSQKQREAIYMNRVLLLLHSNKCCANTIFNEPWENKSLSKDASTLFDPGGVSYQLINVICESSEQIFDKSHKKEENNGISIDHLHRLNQKNISAWNMKRLMNIVKNGMISNLDEKLQSATGEDEALVQITSENQAKAAARNIFINVAKPGSKYIHQEDLMRFMRDDEVLKTVRLFEGVTDEKGISRRALKNWVVNTFRERRALALSLNDTKTAVNKLHQMLNIFVGIIILAIWLLILRVATTQFFIFLSSQLLLVAFMFGNTAKTTFEAIIFLFVMHPFDVGDRVEIEGVQMVVEE